VVSPTSVAAPCRLEAIAIETMLETGDIFNFLAIVKATGATMRTVATLSTNAEMMPAKSDRAMIAHLTLGIFSIMMSARSAGIFDSMKKNTTPMVPAIIRMTFQSTEKKTSLQGKIPSSTNKAAEAQAIYALYFGKTNRRPYVNKKILKASAIPVPSLAHLDKIRSYYILCCRIFKRYIQFI